MMSIGEVFWYMVIYVLVAFLVGTLFGSLFDFDLLTFLHKRHPNKNQMVTDSPEAQDRYLPMFGEPINNWYRKFAWRPVWTIDRGWVWMRFVLRRRISRHPHLPGGAQLWDQNIVSLK